MNRYIDFTHQIVTREQSKDSQMNRKLWGPQTGTQRLGYDCLADELFIGGEAGCGKTDLLLGLAGTAHQKSIIFRREYTELAELITRSRQIFGNTSANFSSLTWRNIPGGRSLEFAACQHEKDKEKFQGRAHDMKAFDEICHFTESQYLYITAWARSTTPSQRVRIIATGNPPQTADGAWVLDRWAPWLDPFHINPAAPGELRWYTRINGDEVECPDGSDFTENGETLTPQSRTFIPGKLIDNKYLADTDYKAHLQSLPEPLRSQLLNGDFMIGRKDDAFQVIPTDWVIQASARSNESKIPTTELTAIGVDVARGGEDQTIIAKRFGNWFAPLIKHPGTMTPSGREVASLVKREISGQAVTVKIDVIGIGASPFDILKEGGVKIDPIHASESTDAKDRTGQFGFINKRAELWWRFREALDPETGEGLVLPQDREILADLCAPRWKETTRGIQIESKDDIRKRLGRSTDCGDALVMALDYAFVAPRPRPYCSSTSLSMSEFMEKSDLNSF